MSNVRTIAVVNMKGGVGKTTTVVNLAHALARTGLHVLVVDLDPQANLTTWLGDDVPPDSLADVLRDPKRTRSAIAASTAAGVDVLHGSRATAIAERELQSSAAPATALRRALRSLGSAYDVVLLDSPPGLGLLAMNAIVAADELLVPIETRTMALAGFGQLRETVDELLEAELLAKAPRMRVVGTMYDGRTGLGRDVLALLRDDADVEMVALPIRLSTKIAESFGHKKSVFDYASTSTGARDYEALAKEIL